MDSLPLNNLLINILFKLSEKIKSEGTGLEFFIAVFFVLIFLSQTSRQTVLSKDPACQSFIIAISYGVLVIYSIDYAGGSLNFAYAFAQDFWNQVEYGQQSAFKFLECFSFISYFIIYINSHH